MYTPLSSTTHSNINNDGPLISIIIPVYKSENYLGQCLDSVINQTYKKIEIILIDDGSPDSCGEMCDEYAKLDNRVKTIHQDNKGVSVARNIGLDNVTGEYIIFVDSDDYIALDMCEHLYRAMESHSADITVCSYYLINQGIIHIPNQSDVSSSSNGVETGKKVRPGYLWGRLFRKSLFEQLRFPVGRKFEDFIVTPLLYERAKKIITIEDRLYYYNRDNENSIVNNVSRNLSSKFDYFFAHVYWIDRDQSFREKFLLSTISLAFEILRKNADDSKLPVEDVNYITKFLEKYNSCINRKGLWFLFRNFRFLFNLYSRYRERKIKQKNK